MGKFEDEQYRKLSQKMTKTHSEREYGRQVENLTGKDMKNMGRKR